MNEMKKSDKFRSSKFMETTVVLLLSFLLFYFPTVFNILSDHDAPSDIFRINLTLASVFMGIFCVNYFCIIPKFLFGRGIKAWFYVINGLLMIVAIVSLTVWFESRNIHPWPGPGNHIARPRSTGTLILHYIRFGLRDFVMMVLSIGLAYAMRLSREREKFHRKELELDAEKRSLELQNLKMQLNPHFLFNSLNNIYSLIGISPEKAQEALHDLSSMLRYMIYDVSTAGVPVIKEIEFIEDFTRLSKLRLGENAELSCDIDRSGIEGLTIAPLLLITLVENAFKHYAPDGGKGFIRISLRRSGEWLEYKVENSCVVPRPGNDSGNKPGIGISNVERQLDLIYPGAFRFEQFHQLASHVAVLRLRLDSLVV